MTEKKGFFDKCVQFTRDVLNWEIEYERAMKLTDLRTMIKMNANVGEDRSVKKYLNGMREFGLISSNGSIIIVHTKKLMEFEKKLEGGRAEPTTLLKTKKRKG